MAETAMAKKLLRALDSIAVQEELIRHEKENGVRHEVPDPLIWETETGGISANFQVRAWDSDKVKDITQSCIEVWAQRVLPEYPLNDKGNMQRVKEEFRGLFRYCVAEKSWYYFNGAVWERDTTRFTERMAALLLDRSYQRQIAQKQQSTDRAMHRELVQLSKKWEEAGSWRSLQNCMRLLETELVIDAACFDHDPHLFQFQNGYLHLPTCGIYFYHDKTQCCTKLAGTEIEENYADGHFDWGGECPVWRKFVLECCQGDTEMALYLQKAAGYSVLSGDISLQKVFCLLGTGRNGKSLFINTLAEIAGDYACKLDSSILTVNRYGERDNDTSKELYRLRGSRFVYANEFGKDAKLNEVFLKAITDGGKISCRPLYGASIEYQPTYKLWFSTNHMPNLRGMDEGIRRRIVVIPFRNQVPEAQVDYTLGSQFRAESSGILRWLIAGYYLCAVQGLELPAVIRKETIQYFAEQDRYQLFLEDMFLPAAEGKLYAKEVYRAYQQWCAENGEKPVSNVIFSRELQRLGVLRERDRRGSYYNLCYKVEE